MIALQFIDLLTQLAPVRRSAYALIVAGTIMPLVGVLIIGLDVITVRFAVMHMALFGSALATWIGWDPLLGALVCCFLTGISLTPASGRSGGLAGPMSMLMTISAAAALLLLSLSGVNANGAFEILWGSILAVRGIDMWLIIVVSLAVIIVFVSMRNKLALLLYDREVAACSGVNVLVLTGVVLVVIAVSVGASIRVTGALLVDSITVLPAVAARSLGTNLRRVAIWAMSLGCIGSIVGFIVALQFDFPPGPVLVLVSGAIAIVTTVVVPRIRSRHEVELFAIH